MKDNLRPQKQHATPLNHNPFGGFSDRLVNSCVGELTNKPEERKDREIALCWLEETTRR